MLNLAITIKKYSDLMDDIILKIHSMGYSIYVVLLAILILLLIILIFRRYKWVSWLIFVLTSAICVYMLFYIIDDMKLRLFVNINNLLAVFDNTVIIISGIIVLSLIVTIGLISLIIGVVRKK